MFQSLLEAVRAEGSGDRALETVRELTRFHRVQASPGYDQAADWLCARLESYGVVPERESVPGDGRTRYLGQLMPEGWECTRAVANLVEGDRRERLCDYAESKLSLILRSAPASGRFPLVAVDGGGEARDYQGTDVTGAVVLVRDPVHRALELAVLERGAAGLLYDGRRLLPPVRDRFDDPEQLAYTSFWWNGDEPRGWGFVVSPRRGDRLRHDLRAGQRLELDVEIESRRFATTIPLVSAALPGRTDREVLVVAHLCHPQPSANDNASGAAAALEAARVLKRLEAPGRLGGEYGVRFLWVPELTGTYAWLARDERRKARVVAGLNLDMVGEDQEQCGSTFLLERPPWFAASFAEELLTRIRERAVDWVVSYSGPGHFSMTRMAEVPYSGGSDHAVLNDPAVGIPCPMLIQWPDRFYHSSHDTPDKCDPRSLVLAVRCAATYAGFLAGAGRAERRWLLQAVERGARVRFLRAADAAEPGRELKREERRATAALASLERLGVERPVVERALEEHARFVARELTLPRLGPPAGRRIEDLERRPRRRQMAPLDAQRHLLSGFEALGPGERAAWRGFEAEVPDATLVFELAWFACDGRRTLAEIAEVVWIETGRSEPDAIGEFFNWTARLGLSDWSSREEAAWSSSAPATDTP
jgi:hypothetical protein